MTRAWFPPPARKSVPAFVRRMSRRHPELEGRVLWFDFLRMAQREGITVRVRPLPDPVDGRLLRIGERVFIQLNARRVADARTAHGMHELCHYWNDDPGEACYYSDEISLEPEEEFANIFAWWVTSTAREYFDKPGWDLS